MPRRNDINKIMIIGSGPIIIGQACEFDYSGSQACKVLREENYKVILINSNPATIMTDFEIANKTYIEPITTQVISKIIEKETPDAILPTLGGQTALNSTVTLSNLGILKKFDVEIIGVNLESINKAESRLEFKKAINNIGFKVAKSDVISSFQEAIITAKKIGFPLVIRSSFTMGGLGSSIVNNFYDLEEAVIMALNNSPISQVIIEESLIGWKEYELELLRDSKGNVIVVCSIENFDPIGIHTGDSITVAPIQTLTDKEYQCMRDAAIDIIREIGVNGGGANIQFAVNPKSGEMIVIEMNPRVSRSSALASKATGVPIAKIATKLAIGYNLNEIKNDITGITKACFEPSIDYCVVKIPVWDNDRFHKSENFLTTTMKSVGETMAIGRTFKEALQKAIRSLGIGMFGFNNYNVITNMDAIHKNNLHIRKQEIIDKLSSANPERLFYIHQAFCYKITVKEISKISAIDPWFIFQLYEIFKAEILFNKKNFDKIKEGDLSCKNQLIKLKSMGFSDLQIGFIIDSHEDVVSETRSLMGLNPVYKSVDTCAAEFQVITPYYYSSYESECEVFSKKNEKKVIILGSGPNRIGQGIEFDYCCVHASLAAREEGFKSIMVNNNPSTVSTDYDVSDRLYFEPLTHEDVMNIIDKETPYGVIIQFGGQIPLNLCRSLEKKGANILGTKPDNINRAENRSLFKEMLDILCLKSPISIAANSLEEVIIAIEKVGYPIILRPSFILGGKSISIIYNHKSLLNFINNGTFDPCIYPILIDKFIQNAMEIEVDIISDGKSCIVCAIMEQIEKAGVHSGDSTCILPAIHISPMMTDRIIKASKSIAYKLGIIGLMNVQYAIKNKELYVLEVNPRASRTVPFVSKAVGIPMVNLATKIMLGKTLNQLKITNKRIPKHISVKKPVFSFNRFPNSEPRLGPSMKSTGEVMGIGNDLVSAYTKAHLATSQKIPLSGTVLISSCKNKKNISYLIKKFRKLGFEIITSQGDFKVNDIKINEIKIIVTIDDMSNYHKFSNISKYALKNGILQVTTLPGALMICDSIKFLIDNKITEVKSLQDHHNL